MGDTNEFSINAVVTEPLSCPCDTINICVSEADTVSSVHTSNSEENSMHSVDTIDSSKTSLNSERAMTLVSFENTGTINTSATNKISVNTTNHDEICKCATNVGGADMVLCKQCDSNHAKRKKLFRHVGKFHPHKAACVNVDADDTSELSTVAMSKMPSTSTDDAGDAFTCPVNISHASTIFNKSCNTSFTARKKVRKSHPGDISICVNSNVTAKVPESNIEELPFVSGEVGNTSMGSVKETNANSAFCKYCRTNFTKRKNLYRHARKFHPDKVALIYVHTSKISGCSVNSARNIFCKYCNSNFSERKNWYRHVRKFHPDKVPSMYDSKNSFTFVSSKKMRKYCNPVLTAKRCLYGHTRKFHSCKVSSKLTSGKSSHIPSVTVKTPLVNITNCEENCAGSNNDVSKISAPIVSFPSTRDTSAISTKVERAEMCLVRAVDKIGSLALNDSEASESSGITVPLINTDKSSTSEANKMFSVSSFSYGEKHTVSVKGSNGKISCGYCKSNFTKHKNVYRHVRKFHSCRVASINTGDKNTKVSAANSTSVTVGDASEISAAKRPSTSTEQTSEMHSVCADAKNNITTNPVIKSMNVSSISCEYFTDNYPTKSCLCYHKKSNPNKIAHVCVNANCTDKTSTTKVSSENSDAGGSKIDTSTTISSVSIHDENRLSESLVVTVKTADALHCANTGVPSVRSNTMGNRKKRKKLYSHNRQFHPNDASVFSDKNSIAIPSKFSCEYCSINFTKRINLYSHIRDVRSHDVSSVCDGKINQISESSKSTCKYCHHVFTRTICLSRHVERYHSQELLSADVSTDETSKISADRVNKMTLLSTSAIGIFPKNDVGTSEINTDVTMCPINMDSTTENATSTMNRIPAICPGSTKKDSSISYTKPLVSIIDTSTVSASENKMSNVNNIGHTKNSGMLNTLRLASIVDTSAISASTVNKLPTISTDSTKKNFLSMTDTESLVSINNTSKICASAANRTTSGGPANNDKIYFCFRNSNNKVCANAAAVTPFMSTDGTTKVCVTSANKMSSVIASTTSTISATAVNNTPSVNTAGSNKLGICRINNNNTYKVCTNAAATKPFVSTQNTSKMSTSSVNKVPSRNADCIVEVPDTASTKTSLSSPANSGQVYVCLVNRNKLLRSTAVTISSVNSDETSKFKANSFAKIPSVNTGEDGKFHVHRESVANTNEISACTSFSLLRKSTNDSGISNAKNKILTLDATSTEKNSGNTRNIMPSKNANDSSKVSPNGTNNMSSIGTDTGNINTSPVNTAVAKTTLCKKCNITFSAKHNLYKHFRKFHPDEVASVCPRNIMPSTNAEGSSKVSPSGTNNNMSPINTDTCNINMSPVNTAVAKTTLCKKCNITFSARHNLYKHFRKFHPDEVASVCPRNIMPSTNAGSSSKVSPSGTNNVCPINTDTCNINMSPVNTAVAKTTLCKECNITFSARHNLCKHIRKFHPDAAVSPGKSNFRVSPKSCCRYCNVNFAKRKDLCSHARKFHTYKTGAVPILPRPVTKNSAVTHVNVDNSRKVSAEAVAVCPRKSGHFPMSPKSCYKYRNINFTKRKNLSSHVRKFCNYKTGGVPILPCPVTHANVDNSRKVTSSADAAINVDNSRKVSSSADAINKISENFVDSMASVTTSVSGKTLTGTTDYSEICASAVNKMPSVGPNDTKKNPSSVTDTGPLVSIDDTSKITASVGKTVQSLSHHGKVLLCFVKADNASKVSANSMNKECSDNAKKISPPSTLNKVSSSTTPHAVIIHLRPTDRDNTNTTSESAAGMVPSVATDAISKISSVPITGSLVNAADNEIISCPVNSADAGKFSCKYCSRNFTIKDNLRAHVKKLHPHRIGKNSRVCSSSKNLCKFCSHAFAQKSSLNRHIKEFHPQHVVTCKYCSHVFTAKKNLYQHIRVLHPLESLEFSHKAICSICEFTCRSISDLQRHIVARHPDVPLSFEEKEFSNVEEFQEWKSKIEHDSQSRFVKRTGNSQKADRITVSYYHCHRSGAYQPIKNRKRRMKRAGTNKIGKTCPANIKVYRQVKAESVKINVRYQSVHAGHSTEVRRTVLTKTEKKQLADLLSQGMPKSEVLRNIRATSSPSKRLSFITRKDLHNICRDYKIDKPKTACGADVSLTCIHDVKNKNGSCDLSMQSDERTKVLDLCHSNSVTVDSSYGISHCVSELSNTEQEKAVESIQCAEQENTVQSMQCIEQENTVENVQYTEQETAIASSQNFEQRKASVIAELQRIHQFVAKCESVELLEMLHESFEEMKAKCITLQKT